MDERARSPQLAGEGARRGGRGGEGRIIKPRPRLIHAYAFYKSALYGLALFDDGRSDIEIKRRSTHCTQLQLPWQPVTEYR
jgi:hypothetical protein